MRMKKLNTKIILCLLLVSILVPQAQAVHAKTEEQDIGQTQAVICSKETVIDYSDISSGAITVSYIGDSDKALRVMITKKGGISYVYTLNNSGTPETFTFPEGDGVYDVGVFCRIMDTKYYALLRHTFEVNLENDFAPFLQFNQFINYSGSTEIVSKAAELVEDKLTDAEKVFAINNYVAANFSYDHEKSSSGLSNYTAHLNDIWEKKSGICVDIAALVTAMCRSQDIPCKMIYGYTEGGRSYHAWVDVYVNNSNSSHGLTLEAGTWNRLDPTAQLGGNYSDYIAEYIENDANYTQIKHRY